MKFSADLAPRGFRRAWLNRKWQTGKIHLVGARWLRRHHQQQGEGPSRREFILKATSASLGQLWALQKQAFHIADEGLLCCALQGLGLGPACTVHSRSATG